MREIKDILFFGSDSIYKRMYKLRARIDEGLELLSGLQQPAHSDSEESAERNQREFEEGLEDLEDVLHDILAAFGYKGELTRE
jgi:hypothetical protein